MSAGMECRLQAAVQRLSTVGDPSCRVGLLQKVVNLAQELLRELNTLCAKCRDTRVVQLGLDARLLCEQIREQVQNVE